MSEVKFFDEVNGQFDTIINDDFEAELQNTLKDYLGEVIEEPKNTRTAAARRQQIAKQIRESGEIVGVKITDKQSMNVATKLYKTSKTTAYTAAITLIFANLITASQGDPIEEKRITTTYIRQWIQIFLDKLIDETNVETFIAFSLWQQTSVVQNEMLNRLYGHNYENIYDKLDAQAYDESEIKGFINRIKWAYLNNKILSAEEFLTEVKRYAAVITSFEGLNTMLKLSGVSLNPTTTMAYNSFGCQVGPVPLPHVQYIEIARSGKVLKFRADGSVFLANQGGGNDAIVVKFLLTGYETLFILALWWLYYYCRGKITELDKVTNDIKNVSMIDIRKLASPGSFNPKTQKPAEEVFLTFPFITRHIIIPNCYVETFVFEDKVMNGKNVINVSLLLRTYRKPDGFSIFNANENQSYFARSEKPSSKMYNTIEFFANTAYRLGRYLGAVIDGHDWKSGTEVGSSNDVYYDVRLEDVANTVAFAAIGLVI